MSTTATPDDLITLVDATTISERSKRTIRRWISGGDIQRWDGPTPDGGGQPVTLVSRSELMTFLAASGQKPKGKQEEPSLTQPGRQPDAQADTPSGALKLARMEGALEVERAHRQTDKVRAELAGALAELDAANERANALQLQLDRTRADLNGARNDVADWRERYDAKSSTLDATRDLLRQEQVASAKHQTGLELTQEQLKQVEERTIWQRLLGGPVAMAPKAIEQKPATS